MTTSTAKATLPEGWKALGDYFAIVPDDNMNLCNCEACAALLQQGRTHKTGFFSSGEMSDYWFTFVNAVAREVRQTHPDKYIATLAYWAYAVPPSFSLEPNVSVAPCLHTCYYPVHAGMRENDMKFYRGWREKTKAPMFLWVYYHHPMEPALIDKWKCFPNVMVHETAQGHADVHPGRRAGHLRVRRAGPAGAIRHGQGVGRSQTWMLMA